MNQKLFWPQDVPMLSDELLAEIAVTAFATHAQGWAILLFVSKIMENRVGSGVVDEAAQCCLVPPAALRVRH